jgi:hypothetical protein
MEHKTRKRYRLIATVFAIGCLLASSVPYLAGWAASSEEVRFGGILILHMEDVYTYLSSMHQGARGSWSYHILHTPEEHRGEPLKLFYLALGKLARPLGLPVALAYQLARIVSGTCLIAAIYLFTGYFVEDSKSHLVAYAMGVVGGGLSWLTAILRALGRSWPDWDPIELWLVEGFSFPTLLVFAHGAMATAILLMTFLSVLEYHRNASRMGLIQSIMWTVALAVVQPLCLPILGTTLAAYQLLLAWRRKSTGYRWFQRQEVIALLTVGAISVTLAVFFYRPFITNEAFLTWEQQSRTPSPPPLHYLWGYGLIVPLAILGAGRALRSESEAWLLPIAWLVAVTALLYMPHLPQRRFSQGALVPLSCLASLGMEALQSRLENRRWPTLFPRLILALTMVSSVILVAMHTQTCLSRTRPVFHLTEELASMQWLDNNSMPDETVLAGQYSSTYTPAAIGHRVFWGHWCETIDLDEKVRQLARFFDGQTSDHWRRHLLARYGIRFLLYEPQGAAQGDFNPSQAAYLAERFRAGDYRVYEVE